jgi:hypothetical protein
LTGVAVRLANVGEALRLDGVVHFPARDVGPRRVQATLIDSVGADRR